MDVYNSPVSVTSFICIGTSFLALALLYYMLIARSVAKGKGSQRLQNVTANAAVALGPFSRVLRQAKHSHATKLPETDARGSQPEEMLNRAVQQHERQSGLPKEQPAGPGQTVLPSIGASQQQQNHGSSQRFSLNALKPSPTSTWNQMHDKRTGGFGGIKRTASGLAKMLDGKFDDGSGSRQDPIIIGADNRQAGRITLPRVTQTEYFDENEFDSDIELDIGHPSTKDPVSYPSLPPPPRPTNRQSPATKSHVQTMGFKPTSTWQQQMQASYTADVSQADSGYASLQRDVAASPQGSSNPLPWSSSPIEHFQPSIKNAGLARFAFAAPNADSKHDTGGTTQNGPSKRRKLPWSDQEKQEQYVKTTTTSRTTPSPHKSEMSSKYPWNSGASAVKEQQRKHREETKRLTKKVEGASDLAQAAKSKKRKGLFLSEEQQHILNLVVEQKQSVFFTGSAGTGKSVLLREIIAALRKQYQREPDRVAVTASTGLAACNIGGVTLHSFAGIGLGKEPAPDLVRKIKKAQKAKHRWMRTKVLIIDEVSMVDAELFDKLESVARQIRNNGRPFGGIQLIITGDFFQLPPVPDKSGPRSAKFAFDAATWNTSIQHTIALHHVFRQKDPVFAGMLNEMREGRLTDSSIKTFRSLSRDLHYQDSLVATELFPTRNEVERANSGRLSHLQGSLMTFDARDGGSIVDKQMRDKLLSNCMAPEVITLKKGAQVMLIKNIDETLVNGSLGKVIGFMNEQRFDSYHANEAAFPATPNGTLMDPGDDPNLSAQERAKTRLDSQLTGQGGLFPVVRFSVADGTFRDLLCQRETWKVELPNGEVQASRSQIPLILAWALSIHKAQGQTLERVKVDLGKVFENGQAYVALSRATSMSGLQVLQFDAKKVTAHERVRSFYSKLSRVELDSKIDIGAKGAKVKKAGVGDQTAKDYEKDFVEQDWR